MRQLQARRRKTGSGSNARRYVTGNFRFVANNGCPRLEKKIMPSPSVKWTQPHTLAASHLYTLLPFGKLHRGKPEIQQLAGWQGRTPSSVAMKLVNFASLDPQIIASGRAGLSGASNQDRMLWKELQNNWDKVAEEAANAYAMLALNHGVAADSALIEEIEKEQYRRVFRRPFEFRPASRRSKTGPRPVYWQTSAARRHRIWSAPVPILRSCQSSSSQPDLACQTGLSFGVQRQPARESGA